MDFEAKALNRRRHAPVDDILDRERRMSISTVNVSFLTNAYTALIGPYLLIECTPLQASHFCGHRSRFDIGGATLFAVADNATNREALYQLFATNSGVRLHATFN